MWDEEKNDKSYNEEIVYEYLKGGIIDISKLELPDNLTSIKLSGYCQNLGSIANILSLEEIKIHIDSTEKIESIDRLPEASSLTHPLAGLEKLSGLPKLKRVYIGQCDDEVYKFLKELPHLKELQLELKLKSNFIDEINNHIDSEISNLRGLEKLDLSSSAIQKITNLNNLKNLKELYLNDNRINKIEGLDNLSHLYTLNLTSNHISQFEGLDSLKSLNLLVLDNNNISKIEGLTKLTGLNTLSLERNNITQIEGLNKLTSLGYLNLGYNSISRIENLDGLTKLQKLELTENKISSIENLDGLINLKHLGLTFNELFKIEGLDSLKNLEYLDLGYNFITKIENFDKLTKLKTLKLRYNNIFGIKGLERLTKLEHLQLDLNDIYEIKNLEKQTRLKHLELDGNKIPHIKNLENLIKLEKLELGINKISKIENIDKLVNLNCLRLNKNKISDLSYLPDYIRTRCIREDGSNWAIDNQLEIDLHSNPIDLLKNMRYIEELNNMGLTILTDEPDFKSYTSIKSLTDKLVDAGIPEEAIDSNQELIEYINSIERNEVISSNRNFFVTDAEGNRWMLKFMSDKRRATMESLANYYLSGSFDFIPPTDMEKPIESNGVYIIKQKDVRSGITVSRSIRYWLDCLAAYHDKATGIFEENMIKLPDAFIRSTEEELERYAQGKKANGFSLDIVRFKEAAKALQEHSDKTFIHNDAKTGNLYGNFILDWELAGLGDPAIDIAMLFANYNIKKENSEHYLDYYLSARNKGISDNDTVPLKERLHHAIYFGPAREVIGSSRRPMTEETRRNNERLITNYLC